MSLAPSMSLKSVIDALVGVAMVIVFFFDTWGVSGVPQPTMVPANITQISAMHISLQAMLRFICFSPFNLATNKSFAVCYALSLYDMHPDVSS